MKKKFLLKNIACALVFSTVILIGGNIKYVNAEPITKDVTMIQTANINNFKESTEKVSNTITITESNIIFDENKAFKEGFTSEEVEKLNSIYDEMNEMINSKKASIIKTANGNYDIEINDDMIQTRASVTSRWYGYDFHFSSRECGDVAAILAGAAATTAAVAGVLGLTGHVPAAIVTTVAAGMLGLGSAYFWYCSNCNGLDASYNRITGISFHRDC